MGTLVVLSNWYDSSKDASTDYRTYGVQPRTSPTEYAVQCLQSRTVWSTDAQYNDHIWLWLCQAVRRLAFCGVVVTSIDMEKVYDLAVLGDADEIGR